MITDVFFPPPLDSDTVRQFIFIEMVNQVIRAQEHNFHNQLTLYKMVFFNLW